jgi:dCTP deaminase
VILSGIEIKKRLGGDIIIEPYDDRRLNPNSYNLRLHNLLLAYDEETLDMRRPNAVKEIVIPPSGLTLKPDKLYLGRTLEYTETRGLVPMLEGRSSVGRLGLYIHVTAGFGDVGFKGFWTLEIHCIEPIIIYPEVEICQIYYHRIEGDYIPYSSGKYQGNAGVQPSMLYKDFETAAGEDGGRPRPGG